LKLQRKTLFLILFISIMIVASSAAVMVLNSPAGLSGVFPECTSVSAFFGGSGGDYGLENITLEHSGSMITVVYETAEVIGRNPTTNDTYMVIRDTGQILPVLGVIKIGYLLTKSEGYKNGWFVIDNRWYYANDTSLVTIKIGGHTYTNRTISKNAPVAGDMQLGQYASSLESQLAIIDRRLLWGFH